MIVRVLYLVLACIFLSGCKNGARSASETGHDQSPIPFRTDGVLTFHRAEEEVVTIDIEIAESDSARARGLMQRESLPEKSGMLFLFPREEIQTFWMANTPVALDLIFLGSDSQIVDIDKYTDPFSPSSITSDAPATYVIEVVAGFADTYGITAGERVTWKRR